MSDYTYRTEYWDEYGASVSVLDRKRDTLIVFDVDHSCVTVELDGGIVTVSHAVLEEVLRLAERYRAEYEDQDE